MRKTSLFILLSFISVSCSLGNNISELSSKKCTTLSEVLRIRKLQKVELYCFEKNYHEIKKDSGFVLYSFFKKKGALPFLVLKLKEEMQFVSALYYPSLEKEKYNKGDILKLVPSLDWQKEESVISPDDRTYKVLYLTKIENLLFGFYEINEQNIHFVSVGSVYEPEKFKDFFIF